MSADNYTLIRKNGARYVVSNEHDSDDAPSHEWHPHNLWFDSFAQAMEYAHNQYTEYGIVCDFPTHIEEGP